MKNALKLFLLTVVLSFSSCQYEEVLLTDQADVIAQGSDLFERLIKMTGDSDEPLENINCIIFNYSFYVLVYDSSFDVVNSVLVTDDPSFSNLLTNVPAGHSISISFPISTTLADGTPFDIHTNEDLSSAIESCEDEEFLGNCYEMTMACAWSIPYLEDEDNTYAAARLNFISQGLVSMDYQGETYDGTWVYLRNNGELEANVHFSETDLVAADWSFNFRVEHISLDEIVIAYTANDKRYTLMRNCEPEEEYLVGDIGPKNGIVVYDKGDFTEGWRYIEMQTDDLPIEEWGCLDSDLPLTDNGSVGQGWEASVAIANFHAGMDDYFNAPDVCNPQNNGTVAAHTALLYKNAEQENWFLPSYEELELLYSLHQQGLGGFEQGAYWSATQSDSANAKALDFSIGQMVILPKSSPGVHTRAIRYF